MLPADYGRPAPPRPPRLHRAQLRHGRHSGRGRGRRRGDSAAGAPGRPQRLRPPARPGPHRRRVGGRPGGVSRRLGQGVWRGRRPLDVFRDVRGGGALLCRVLRRGALLAAFLVCQSLAIPSLLFRRCYALIAAVMVLRGFLLRGF